MDPHAADDRHPCATRPPVWHVPVRRGSSGLALRLFRSPTGRPTVVAFTTHARLSAVLGADQESVRLGEDALRALAHPLDVTTIVLDPTMTRPLPATTTVVPSASPVRARPLRVA